MKEIKLNTSYHKSTSKGDKQEQKAYYLTDIATWMGHNFRTYKDENNKSIKSKIDFNLTKNNHYLKNELTYKNWFNRQIDKKYIDEYNSKQTRKDRTIKDYDYFDFISNKKGHQSAIGEQLILSFGSEEDYKNLNELLKTDEDWIKLWTEYHIDIINELKIIIPNFKIYNSALHLDETTPHIHVIGVGFVEMKEMKNGLRYRLSSKHVFNRETLKEHHLKLRDFNEKYAIKLNELIKKKNLVYKNDKFITKPKGLLKSYEKVEFLSNKENIKSERKLLRVKDKEVANLIGRIKTNLIKKKDLKVLNVYIKNKLGEDKTKNELINEMLEEQNIKLNNQIKYESEKLYKERYNETLGEIKEQYNDLLRINEIKIKSKVNDDLMELSRLKRKIEPLERDYNTLQRQNNYLREDIEELKQENKELKRQINQRDDFKLKR